MGLPGSGKTTLARLIARRVGGIHWNADEVRDTINKHLTFSHADRMQQAYTMRWLADKTVESGNVAVVDFICPTPETRKMFKAENAFVIWVDRIQEGRFEDTNKMFVPPEEYDVRVVDDGRSAEDWMTDITGPWFDW